MMSKPPVRRAAYIDYQAEVYRAFSGGSKSYDEAVQRELSARAHDRMFYPNGFARQMAAIACAPGRREILSAVSAPTLVLHGDCDTVVPLPHGNDTAAAISGAEMLSAVAGHTEAAAG